MHAKCVVVDHAIALVTSANFTSRGHERNIEVGVLIQDSTFAGTLERYWMTDDVPRYPKGLRLEMDPRDVWAATRRPPNVARISQQWTAIPLWYATR
jgi:phosphatidylserine/phosphatidylglycerophosphate/cardiolipin synthase-like enzyme